MFRTKEKTPPINKVIWVSANDWNWFQVKIMHIGRDVFVWRHVFGRGLPRDVAEKQAIRVIFPQWKYKLDGTEKQVFYAS